MKKRISFVKKYLHLVSKLLLIVKHVEKRDGENNHHSHKLMDSMDCPFLSMKSILVHSTYVGNTVLPAHDN